jgi:hypothetical protein
MTLLFLYLANDITPMKEILTYVSELRWIYHDHAVLQPCLLHSTSICFLATAIFAFN